MNLLSQIESILFVAAKPLSLKAIAKAVGKSVAETKEVLEELKSKYNKDSSGINILENEKAFVMATNSINSSVIEDFIKDEVSGELTKPQLETLTVIAYREPITRPELEQIRGVNCSIILRNLLIRGLVEEKDDKDKIISVYILSFEALRHLGIKSVHDLPNYDILHQHEHVESVLNDK